MDIGHMLCPPYGIRQAGNVDGGIEIDIHHVGIQLLFNGVVHF